MGRDPLFLETDLVDNGRLPTQAVVGEAEAAPLAAAVVRLRLDELLAVAFLLVQLLLPPLLLAVAPLLGALGAQLGHVGGAAGQVPSVVLHRVLRTRACRGRHGSRLPQKGQEP